MREFKSVAFNGLATGDNELVAAEEGKIITVRSLCIVGVGGVMQIRFESGAGGTALTGIMHVLASHPLVMPECPSGCFSTVKSQSLSLELTVATTASGWLTYSLSEV